LEQLLFKKLSSENITNDVATSFIELLKKQDKVKLPSIEKIKACRELVLCYADHELIAIAALKSKTKSAFDPGKSDLAALETKFTWELGYIYVEEPFRGLGISLTMSRLLILEKVDENFLASTELHSSNAMIKVLEKMGFKQYGKPWTSSKHEGTLGLFFKFKRGDNN
jgi:hypothetical protein